MRKKLRKIKNLKRITSILLVVAMTLGFCLSNSSLSGVFASANRKIDVWDFGGVAESDTSKYNNNITAAFWNASASVDATGKFLAGTTTAGDLSINHTAGDRLYSISDKNYGINGFATTAFTDGYTANGMYYCNGSGGETRRFLQIDNVKAGDKIVVYMASSNAATDTVCFKYLGSDGVQQDTDSFTNVGAKHEFIAKYDGSYKIYAATAGGGKPVFNRAVRIPGVEVTGTIDVGSTGISGYGLTFSNQTTGEETIAKLNGSSYSVVLAAGESYTASLTNAIGFGFTNASKVVNTTVDDVFTGLSNVKLTVESKSTYTYSGTIKGFDSSYDVSKLSVVLEAPEESLNEDVNLTINQDLTFSATLEPDVSYTIKLKGVNDYEVTSGGTVSDNQNVTADIIVGLKAKYTVTGGFMNLPKDSAVSSITFTNMDDSYSYEGTVTSSGYEVQLRDGSYSVKTTVDNYTTNTHIVVNGKNVSKDLMFVSTLPLTPMEKVSDIYVGYPEKPHNYNTVNEAIKACQAMNPTSESERITVHIAPGTYREQVIISTPYISLVNDEKEQVLMTWYYGIGYQYYSADGSGYYNPEFAYDQFTKKTTSKWGCATYVKNTATGFKAENITFEASFNRYITDEELADGIEVSGGESITFARKYGVDVKSKAATERSSAMAIEADNVEFNNCEFLGSQDTLYTGNTAANIYFKNCLVEGNTDYIFGDGSVVFDGCELSFAGYSTGSQGGYLTANKPSAGALGYLFRNCTITGNADLTVSSSYLGRPWGADAKTAFLNTKVADNSLLLPAGWTEMSGNKPQNANFKEYNTKLTNGKAVDTSQRVTGVISGTDASAISVKSFFGDWTPSNYTEEDSTVAFVTVPSVTDNGDINAPYPGHTLTVNYSLGNANNSNDASLIQWYSVDSQGVETLLKSSASTVDRTYKITSKEIGKQIKVTVTPETFSGKTAESKSYKLEATVRDGYEDPSGSGGDIELGDGVNIFLAGDSTVKDYSASGMYMNGKAQSEGAWGEYLQSFFDSSKVKIQNYANGGRSTRNFMNEGSLDKIAANIGTGDYLFIQFAHNDCSNGTGYLEDRYVPLGTPDANGIYPVTEGKKVQTPASYVDKYGPEFYSYDCGGTYKWYLQQYIDAAKAKGAIPVLVTPVSRMYYNADGTIRPHHDSTDATTGTQVTSNDAYVQAVKQLAAEQKVLLVDAFDLTKKMYQDAYKNDPTASGDKSEYGSQVMSVGDKTHSNKLGGFVTAEIMAQQIQNMGLNISKAVKMPTQVAGENTAGQQVFSVNNQSAFSAFASDKDGNFTVSATYWSTYGQKLIDEIGVKAEDLNKPSEPGTTTQNVWVVGDSTVSGFADKYYYPRYGWGTQLDSYFDSSLVVKNLALSGRSSKSYINDPEYTTLMNGMQSGDFLMVGFGHNDEKAEADRYTNPNGTYQDAGSFAHSLYTNYIKPAQEKGVTVILTTPIVRRTATGEWTNSNLHITSTVGDYPGGNYSQAIINLGKDLNIPVVDMTSLTKSLYDTLGASETLNMHSWTSSKGSSVDNTHTNIWGAKYNAFMITKAMKELNITGMSAHILTASAPTKADTLVVNPDYVESGYSPDLEDSLLWDKFGIWKGTVFGSVGGNPSAANQTIEKDADGNMHIAVKNNKGKISSTADGIAMYYYRVPANSTFTLTAKAKINSFDVNDQVSFGLMARDEMYIDKNITDPIGDYVAAGLLKLAQPGSIWNSFARKSSVLTQGGTCANTYKAGDSVQLKIESTSDGYACTFGNEQTVTGGFDFKLTQIDSEYVYVGMYAARNADITFSDIKLVVDGKEVVEGTEPGEPEEPEEPDVDEPVIKEETVTDSTTGAQLTVKVEASEGVIPTDAKLAVSSVSSGDAYNKANELFGKEKGKFQLLDISILNGQGAQIQPNGSVKVSINVPSGYDSAKVKIFRIETDGTATDMNAVYKDGKLVFTTDHFSHYVLAQSADAQNPGDNTGGEEGSTSDNNNGTEGSTPGSTDNSTAAGNGENDSANTGDFVNSITILFYMFGIIASLGAAVLLFRRRRENH